MTDINNRLDPQDAEDKINEIAKFGYFTETGHLLSQMRKRHYDFQDVEMVLSGGKVKEPPEFNQKHNQWRYKIRGKVVNGEMATIVVAIISDQEILGITIMDK